jgi:two-component system NtrC family sensor kinase
VVGRRDFTNGHAAAFDTAGARGVDLAAPDARVPDGIGTAGGEVDLPNTTMMSEAGILTSAPLLQRILDSLVDGIIAVDADGKVVCANRRIAELIDIPRGGIRPGISFFDVLLARARAGAFGPGDPVAQARERLAAKLDPGGAPVRSYGKGGRVLEVRRGELGDGGFVAIYTDITERDRLEREERSSEQRLREIVEANPLPMTITMVSDGRVVYANQRAAEMMRTPLSELVGMRSLDFYADAADRDRVVSLLRNRGFVDALEVRFRRAGAGEFWLALTCRPITYGGQPAIVSGFHDLTERRQSMVELARRTNMLDAISYAATRIVGDTNWRDGIQELLNRLGVAAEVDRVTLFETHQGPDGRLVESCRYDWAAPSLRRLSDDPRYQNMSLAGDGGEELDDWARRRQRGEVVQAMLSETTGYTRQVFEEHGTLSFVSVPIMVKGNWWGFLGFDDCRTERVWTELEVDVLKSAAALVAAAIERSQVDEMLRLSEERYALAARGANDGLWDWDVVDQRAYYSPRLHEILGVPHGALEPTPQALIDRIVAEDRARANDYLARRFARKRRKFAVECRIERPGRPRWVALRGMIVYENDRPARLVGSVHDIDERKQAEAALREREERLQILTGDAPVLLWMVDAQDRLIFANRQYLSFFGRKVRELPADDWDWTADVHPDDVAEVKRRYFDAFARQASFDSEYRARRHDGEYRWVRDTQVARFQPDGSFAGFVGALVDITDRKRAEEELARQREALYQSEKLTALGSLLAGVAHELNNPLSVVVGQATMLADAASDPKTADRAQKIRRAADRCARIVRTFLSLARRKTPELTAVQLNTVVEMAVELLAYQLRTGDVELSLDLAADLPPLLADADQLNQVVTNLVHNALQALSEAAGPRRLTIATGQGGNGALRLTVADNGPGVPIDLRTRIFEPFFTTKSPGAGTGIGLSLCLGIVASHGGAIRVEETPGGGATFVVELPLRGAVAVPAAAAAARETRPLGPRRRILVVDDEPEIAETLAEMLRDAGHSVETAENGRQALDRLAAGAYDLVMSDLRMPVMDGPALYSALRIHHPGLLGRIAFVTGDMLSAQMKEFLAMTGVPSIEKPFTTEAVRALLARLS